MRKVFNLLVAMMLMMSLVACSTKEDENGVVDASTTITIVDHANNSVEITKNVERIVVCDILPLPSTLAVFFNSAKKIVGMAPASYAAAKNSLLGEIYPEILNASTDFFDGSDINLEELLKLNPDVVFYSASNPALGEKLTNAGFAAVAISVNKWEYDCIETLNNWISLISQIFPNDAKTELVANYSKEIYDMINKRTASLSDEERTKVFFLFQYTDAKMLTSGKLFFGNWWAEAIGAKNVAVELATDNSVAVNMEQVYAWNPELVFITNFTTAYPEDLYNNTIGNYDWSGIEAITNKQVYKMPLGMYRSYTPGVDTPMTLLYLAKCVYPDLFSDIDMTSEVKKYYQEVFNVELTNQQVEAIFAPTKEAATGFANK